MAVIQSPLPGTFYHKPSPEEPPFKSEGSAVKTGDTIGLIEVMKTFIEIKSEVEGIFAGYRTDDAAPIQAGDVVAEVAG
ncbi:MAG: acetyl-CoA carboxylase [Sneathiella sp.]